MRRKVTLSFILNRYIPAHPVDRYTFKKWDTNDWARHNENKYFQVKLIVLIVFPCELYIRTDRDKKLCTKNLPQ